MSKKALSGVKVVELGDFVSAPWCGKLMADLGAEVIKVEQPSVGDSARHYGPFLGDIPHPERSGLFLYLNANKHGVTLDVTKTTGRRILLQLLEQADVLIESSLPSRMAELELDYAAISSVNPRLVVTSITPYGQTGPYSDYKAFDINICAMGGLGVQHGTSEREPIRPPLNQAHYQSGLAAATATMFALLGRDVTGEGQHVDVSEADVLATVHSYGGNIQSYVFEGRVRKRSGHRARSYYPWTILPCKDGYISMMAVQGFQWKRFLEIVGGGELPEWYTNDPRFTDRMAIGRRYADEMDALLAPWLMAHTKLEIFEMCQAQSVPFTPVKSADELVNDDHLRERGFFVEIDREDTGPLTYPGAPYQFSVTPWAIRRPAPFLGEHNAEIYRGRLGLSAEELRDLRLGGII